MKDEPVEIEETLPDEVVPPPLPLGPELVAQPIVEAWHPPNAQPQTLHLIDHLHQSTTHTDSRTIRTEREREEEDKKKNIGRATRVVTSERDPSASCGPHQF